MEHVSYEGTIGHIISEIGVVNYKPTSLSEGPTLCPSETNMRVNWDDELPNRFGNIKHVPNHQLEMEVMVFHGFPW